MEISQGDVAGDGDEAADIVFPSGKSATPEETHPPVKAKRGKNEHVAQGHYGNISGSAFRPKTRCASTPEPPRTPLQSGIYKLVEASVRCVVCVVFGSMCRIPAEVLCAPDDRQ